MPVYRIIYLFIVNDVRNCDNTMDVDVNSGDESIQHKYKSLVR